VGVKSQTSFSLHKKIKKLQEIAHRSQMKYLTQTNKTVILNAGTLI
jgi:hypothetical protein